MNKILLTKDTISETNANHKPETVKLIIKTTPNSIKHQTWGENTINANHTKMLIKMKYLLAAD